MNPYTSHEGKNPSADVTDACHVELSKASDAYSPTANQDLSIQRTEIDDVVSSYGAQKYTENDDEAMKAMANFDGEPLIMDEETSRRLLRKIDWHLMPVM